MGEAAWVEIAWVEIVWVEQMGSRRNRLQIRNKLWMKIRQMGAIRRSHERNPRSYGAAR